MGPKGQRRRRQFLQAAVELFSSQGFAATTTRAVAEHAGTGESLLFRYFPTKQDLFEAAVTECGPRGLFELPTDELAELDFGAALACFARSYLNTMWAHREWLGVLHREAQRDPEAQRELSQQYKVVGDALRALLEERVKRGEVRVEAAGAGLQIIALATRGFIARVARSEPEDWEHDRDTFLESLTEVITHGVLASSKTKEGKR